MVFPATPLDVEVSIALSADLSDPGSWSWTDITSYVREGRKIRIRRGRSSERSTVPPSRCTLTVDNTDGRFCRFLPTGAWYGQIGKNTPLRVRVDNGSGYVTRFIGYVAGWPPTWDPSETDQTVELTADGILRRLGQGRVLRGALERVIAAGSPIEHWPLTDESSATTGGSALSGGQAMRASGGTPAFGSGSDLPPGIGRSAVSLSNAGLVGEIVGGSASAWTVEFCAYSGESATGAIATIYLTGGTWSRVDLLPEVSGTDLTLYQVHRFGGVTDSDVADVTDWADRWHHYAIACEQSGGNVDTTVYCDGVEVMGQLLGSITLGAPLRLSLNSLQYTGPISGIQAGQAAVYNRVLSAAEVADRYEAMLGWPGEMAHERVERLCAEEGVPVTVTATSSQAMGGQRVDTLVNLLRECAITDFGLLYEPLDAGLAYLASTERYNLGPAVTLEYDERHIAPPWDPTDDDRDFFNDVTASAPGGSSRRYTDEASIDAVGVYDNTLPANTELDSQLADIAGWAVNLGTVDELRWPAVKLNLLGVPTLIDSWMAADLGNQLHITGHPSPLAPDDIRQIIEGYDETFGSYQYDVTANLSPASGWDVAELEDADLGRLAADGSTIDHAITSSTTSWNVLPNGTRWTTNSADFSPDMFVTVGGEVVQISDISNAVTFRAVGTASHGNGASVTPGLPAGLTTGDQMFMVVACRNTAVTINTPAGWSFIGNVGSGNIRFYTRTATSSESSPTVSFVGAGAGDDTTGQICAFSGVSNDFIMASSNQSNSSAQDIAYPALNLVGIDGQTDQCLVILAAWKQDDWTSVAPPSGYTEIDEPDTATGNDHGVYWCWYRQLFREDVAAGSIVVTGGGAAISRARQFAFAGYQTFTVAARSVNGVVKSHAAGAEVQVYRPMRAAL